MTYWCKANIDLCGALTLFQEWNDMNLRWNTSEFGGVRDLRIPPHRLWKPDVLMYNRSVKQTRRCVAEIAL